jgi:hypothetical protein
MTFQPADFPLLRAARGNRAGSFIAAVETIAQGVEAQSIFNVDLKDAKDTLNRAVDEADAALRAQWTNSGKWEALPAEVFTLISDLSSNLSNIHGAISASKKLASTKLSHPAIEAYRAVVAEALVLALAVGALKSFVVQGRKPDPKAVAARAAKLANVKSQPRATCACCFSTQAVLPNGFIHDHGYTLPRAWSKSGSCYGRQFQPLETSDAGLHFMADLLTKFIASTSKALRAAPARTSIVKENRFSKKSVTLNVGDAGFDYELKSIIFGLEQSIKNASKDLGEFQAAIAAWAPKAY